MATTRQIVCAAVGLAWLLGAAPARAQGMDGSVVDASAVDAAATPDASPTPDAAEPPDAAAGDGDGGAGCGSVDGLGSCQGNLLRVCVGGVVQQQDCAVVYGPGFVCTLLPPLNAAQCVLPGTDGGGVAPDGGDTAQEDAGVSINPARQGCSCVRPTFGEAALYAGMLVWLRPRRRRAV